MRVEPKLDRLDFKILAHLQRNGRVTNVDLADAVGLSASPCLHRVRRLETSGYIIGYGAQLCLAKFGSSLTVFTEVTLADHDLEDFVRFEEAARKIPEIVECHVVSGGYDYIMKVVTKNVARYQVLIEGMLEGGLGIDQYFSYIVLRSPIILREEPVDRIFGSTAP